MNRLDHVNLLGAEAPLNGATLFAVMSSNVLTSPILLGGVIAGTMGAAMLLQARVQTRLLRRRIATGAGTAVFDPATGMFSAAAAWECIRAEASRARRVELPLIMHVGVAASAEQVDAAGAALMAALPDGACAIRIDRRHACVLSIADHTMDPATVTTGLTWHDARLDPSDDTADAALAFLARATSG